MNQKKMFMRKMNRVKNHLILLTVVDQLAAVVQIKTILAERVNKMGTAKELKQTVKEKYGEIAVKNQTGCGCGCGSKSNKIVGYTVMQDNYTNLEGYIAEADLGLGCGVPTEYAGIKKVIQSLTLAAVQETMSLLQEQLWEMKVKL